MLSKENIHQWSRQSRSLHLERALSVFCDIKINGTIPEDRPQVIAVNHYVSPDGRYPLCGFMVAASQLSLKEVAIIRQSEKRLSEYSRSSMMVLKTAEALGFKCFPAEMKGIRQAINHLENKGVIVISPEGDCSHGNEMLPAQQGAAFLSQKTGAPILPVGLSYDPETKDKDFLNPFNRVRLRVNIGNLIDPLADESLSFLSKKEWRQEVTRRTMSAIAAQVSPKQLGEYGHRLLQGV